MSIFEDVLAFIRSPDAGAFEPLALSVFRHQFQTVAAYRAYCLERGAGPESVRSLDDIPAVSTVAFKYAHLGAPVTSRAPGGEAMSGGERTFLTSGTTDGRERRGRHFVPRLEIYRAAALSHLGAMMFGDGRRLAMLALHPTADAMPESSLAQMISWCMEEFGSGAALCAAGRERVDTAAAHEFLAAAGARGEPVSILGTTAALAALLDELRARGERLRLAPGSRLMDTGGTKGQAVPLGAAQVAAEAERWLGIAPEMAINEYGMTELCSQLYDATQFNARREFAAPAGERLKLAPPWLKVTAVDPVTLAPLGDGAAGLLRFFDLANVGSVCAILTEDVGIARGGAVRLLGRAAGGEPRGCALAVGQFASVFRRLASEPGSWR